MSERSPGESKPTKASSSPQRRMRLLLVWGLGPAVVGLLALAVGQFQAGVRPGSFFGAPALVSEARLAALEGAPYRALANAVWAYGDFTAARRVVQQEIHRLSDVGGPERARAFVRFGLVETSPDGQRALFAQACQDDPQACQNLTAMAQREADARFVAPGNRIPMRLLPNQPRIPGH